MAYQAVSDSMLLRGFLHGIALLGKTQQGPLRNTSLRMLPPPCIKELQGPQEVTLAGTSQSHLHTHDGSDIKSESVDLNSWTRSGGHLMRTTSADKIIEFAQNLDVDNKLSKGMMGHHNNFVIQMVGKDPYYQVLKVATPDSENNGPSQISVDECMQLDCAEKEIDASSVSECGDNFGYIENCLSEADSGCDPK